MSTIRIRARQIADYTEIRLLIDHPTENGRNRDADGRLIPAYYLEELRVHHNGRLVVTARMAGSLAANPFFAFRLHDAAAGDRIGVGWTDNLGRSDSLDYRLPAVQDE